MPDNFSNNFEQRVFSAETPPKISAAYNRESKIENQIAECLQLTEQEFLERLAIEKYKVADYLKGETLICLLSLAQQENLTQIVNLIALKLTKIAHKLIGDFLKGKGFNQNFIDEATEFLVFEMFSQIIERKEVSYDFWEVNFYVSLERLARNYLRKHGAKAQLTNTFSELSSKENEEQFDFESNLPKFETLTIEEKLEIKEILRKMPDEHYKIFIYYHIEDWKQEQIAKVFGITARTIRTRLRQIDEFLQQFRNKQGGEK